MEVPDQKINSREGLLAELGQYSALFKRMLSEAESINDESLRIDRMSELGNMLAVANININFLRSAETVSPDELQDIINELKELSSKTRDLIGRPDFGGKHTEIRVTNSLRGEG